MATLFRDEDILSQILACEYAAQTISASDPPKGTDFYNRAKALEAEAKAGYIPVSPSWLPGSISHSVNSLADDIQAAVGVNPLDQPDDSRGSGEVSDDPQFSTNLADNLAGNGRDLADAAADDVNAVKKAAATVTDKAAHIARVIMWTIIGVVVVVGLVFLWPAIVKAKDAT